MSLPRNRRIAALFVVFGLSLTACGGSSGTSLSGSGGPLTGLGGTAGAQRPADTRFAGSGPYAAGTTVVSWHGDRYAVWYPATAGSAEGKSRYTYSLTQWVPAAIAAVVLKNAPNFPDSITEDAYSGLPAAAGRFPVVLFAHGHGGYPDQSSFLTAQLASWGFVVVAPDIHAWDLTSVFEGKASGATSGEALVQALALAHHLAAPGGLLTGRIDFHAVATLGHSQGGAAAVLGASDPAVTSYIAMAGVPARPPTKSKPVLLMTGSADQEVPTGIVQSFYRHLSAPKSLLVIDGAGHNVFDDICAIGAQYGGLGNAAKHFGLPLPPNLLSLATDGCQSTDVSPPLVWPLIEQATIAQLRYTLGVNAYPLGLGPGLDHAFAGVTAHFETAG